MRICIPDLLNKQGDLLEVCVTPWDKIENVLAKESSNPSEYEFNRSVSKALHDYANANSIISYANPIAKWAIGFGQSVCYWCDLYTVSSGRACFPFFDPRITNRLTVEARRFAFSVMHERIRVPDPDFSDAKLMIIQFAKDQLGGRSIQAFDSDNVSLFDFDMLNAMVTRTYQIWKEILEEREGARATGTDDFGPLFA